MAYAKRGPWPPRTDLTHGDLNAFDAAIAAAQDDGYVDLGATSGAVTLDRSQGVFFRLELTGAASISLTNMDVAGMLNKITLFVSTNGHPLTMPAGKAAGGSIGPLVGEVDEVEFQVPDQSSGTVLMRHVHQSLRYRPLLLAAGADRVAVTWSPGDWLSYPVPGGAYDVAYSPELGVFVAAGEYLSSSPDAREWTERIKAGPYGNSAAVSAVWAANVGGGVFLTGGLDSPVRASADGKTWQASNLGNVASGFAYSPSLGKVLAAPTGKGLTQTTDGLTWTPAGVDADLVWWLDDAAVFVRRYTTGGWTYLAYSANGTSWTDFMDPTHNGATAVAHSASLGRFLVAAGGPSPAVSTASSLAGTWTEHPAPVNFSSIQWDPDSAQFVGVADARLIFDTARDPHVWTSPDGITWTPHETGGSSPLRNLEVIG